MNGTAVRLPDQFSPGAAAANAATPTCCCCCCCCVVSSVGAAVHIPEALYRDTEELPEPRSALVLPAALFPLLAVLLPFATLIEVIDLHWSWWVIGLGASLAWAVAAGFLAKSPKPWASVLRLLGWCALWCVEFLVLPFTLLPLAVGSSILAIILGILYLAGAVALGVTIFRHYRRKP